MTRRELIAIGCAVAGLAVSMHLAAFQLHWISQPSDVVFGPSSSRAVLRSSLSRALPVPDALVGAVAYGVEAVVGTLVAIAPTWLPARRTRRAYEAVVTLAALAGLALTGLQAAVIHHFCELCLVSAAISVTLAVLVWSNHTAATAS